MIQRDEIEVFRWVTKLDRKLEQFGPDYIWAMYEGRPAIIVNSDHEAAKRNLRILDSFLADFVSNTGIHILESDEVEINIRTKEVRFKSNLNNWTDIKWIK